MTTEIAHGEIGRIDASAAGDTRIFDTLPGNGYAMPHGREQCGPAAETQAGAQGAGFTAIRRVGEAQRVADGQAAPRTSGEAEEREVKYERMEYEDSVVEVVNAMQDSDGLGIDRLNQRLLDEQI